jgi:DNA end-binding protein Ku
MARAVWSGAVSFGLVNIPVKVYTGTRDHAVHFHQLDRKTGSRIRYEKVAEKTGKEVDPEQIELGYEMDKGKLVVVDPAELDELRPRSTRTIDISAFVELGEIDPAFYVRTYWLVPAGEAASRAYRLLLTAMQDRNRAGVGMVVMRNKQYLAAIRPRDGALAMSTMRFADEVVGRSEVEGLPAKSVKADRKEIRLATQIIDSLSGPWKPESYHDTFTEEVREFIQAHEKGQDEVVEEAPAARAETADLLSALEASLRTARSRGDRAKALGDGASRLTEHAPESSDQADDPDSAEQATRARGRSRRTPSTKVKGRKSPAKKAPARRSAAQASSRKSA